MKIVWMIGMLVAVTMTSGAEARAAERKSKVSKTPWTCRVPLIRSTPLCPSYNQRMLQKYSPQVPTYSSGGSSYRYYSPYSY